MLRFYFDILTYHILTLFEIDSLVSAKIHM